MARSTPFGQTRVRHVMGKGVDENQRADPLGTRGGVVDDGRTADASPDKHGLLISGSIEYSVGVGNLPDEVVIDVTPRGPKPSGVVEHRPAERSEATGEPDEAWLFAQQVEGNEES